MELLKKMFLPLVLVSALPLHVGHGDEKLRQRAPHFILHLFSKYEHVIMRTIDYLATREWIHNHAFTKRLVDSTSKAIVNFINGEILNLEEARRLIEAIDDGGYAIAVGTCPCRRARNMLSDTVPNNADMVFGRWAEEYLDNYPGLYARITRGEALEALESFDRHGFIHQIYGFPLREGAAFVLCNCAQDVCIPLKAQRERGYPAFRKGRSVAVADAGACVGVDECGVCISRCPFEARSASGGKAVVDRDKCYGCGVCVASCKGEATSLERKPGAQLIFARHLVD
jgi:ferredoxin